MCRDAVATRLAKFAAVANPEVAALAAAGSEGFVAVAEPAATPRATSILRHHQRAIASNFHA
jgi:hypothetical protein